MILVNILIKVKNDKDVVTMKMKVLAVVSLFSCITHVYAEDHIPSVEIPKDLGGPRFLAWNNDYSYLSKSENRQGTWNERLNYIPLGNDAENYITVGGEARWMYEYLNHATANLTPQDRNESVAQRLRLFGDLHLQQNFRMFLELGDNWAFDAEVPTPANYDAFDIQQFFVDYRLPITENLQLTLRPGRFVMPLGSKILVSTRDGSNVQYNYDGLATWFNYRDQIKIDVFDVKPVKFQRGSFDDKTDQSRELKGIYFNGKILEQPANQAKLDLYYFDMHHDQRIFTDGADVQNRKSIGARVFGQKENIDYDFEYIRQFGDYGDKNIRAYAAFSQVGYHFEQKLNPHLSLQSMLFSGDNDLQDQRLKTFESPFPRTALFSGAAEFGLMNAIFIKPTFALDLMPNMNLKTSYGVLKKHKNNDAIYHAPSGIAWNEHDQTKSKDIAGITEVELDYQYNRNLNFNLLFSNVDAAQALKETGGKTNNYLSVTTQFKF